MMRKTLRFALIFRHAGRAFSASPFARCQVDACGLIRARSRSFLLVALAILGLASVPVPCLASGPGDSMVIIAVKFSDGITEWGTGAFVDHDGLILTADHVIHRALAKPLSTMTQGSAPASTNPVSITVYSKLFVNPLTVDLTNPGNVLGGAYSDTQWMDAAFVRVTLDDTKRQLIAPFDISLSPPQQGEELTAWGPDCTNVADPSCDSVTAIDSVKVTLNSPDVKRDYQVRANLNVGFSGGPLINSSGMIVGIASWGLRPDGAPDTGTQIVTATYLPGIYITRDLTPRLASSAWLKSPAGCTNTANIRPLTALDTSEMFPADPAASDCPCCCSSLSRSPNSTNTRIGNSTCAQQSDCQQYPAFVLANAVRLAANTNTVDDKTVKDYLALRAVLASPDTARLPADQRAKLYDAFGSTGLALVISPAASNFSALSGVSQDALVAYKKRAAITITPAMYANVARLWSQKGNPTHAADAKVMEVVAAQSPDTIGSMHVNVNKLNKAIFEGVPSSIGK